RPKQLLAIEPELSESVARQPRMASGKPKRLCVAFERSAKCFAFCHVGCGFAAALFHIVKRLAVGADLCRKPACVVLLVKPQAGALFEMDADVVSRQRTNLGFAW